MLKAALLALLLCAVAAQEPVLSITKNTATCGGAFTTCQVFLTTAVPLGSVQLHSWVQFGTLVGSTNPSVNLAPANACSSEVSVPTGGATGATFAGMNCGTFNGTTSNLWSTSGICGQVTPVDNTGKTGLGKVQVANIVMDGLGAQTVIGELTAFVYGSNVAYPYQFCCGARCAVNPTPAKACQVAVDFNSATCSIPTKRDNTERAAPCATTIGLTQEGFQAWNLPTQLSLIYGNGLDLTDLAGLNFTIVAGDTGFNTNPVGGFAPPTTKLTVDGLADITDRGAIAFKASGLRSGSYNVEVWSWDDYVRPGVGQPAQLGTHDIFWGEYTGPASLSNLGSVAATYTPSPTAPGTVSITTTAGKDYFVAVKIDPTCTTSGANSICKGRLNGFRLTFVDVSPPTLTCADVTQFITTPVSVGCTVNPSWDQPTAVTDNCPLPGLTLPASNPAGSFPPGALVPTQTTGINLYTPARGPSINQFTYSFKDAAGNTGTCGFKLTIADKDAPSFVNGCPSYTTTNDKDLCSAVFSWPDPATSARGCANKLVYTNAAGAVVNPGDSFPVADNVITATATDVLGRTASCSFHVVVQDKQPPVQSCNAQNAELRCGPGYQDWLAQGGYATITDNCPLRYRHTDAVYCGSDHLAAPTLVQHVFTALDINNDVYQLGGASFATHEGSCTCDFHAPYVVQSSTQCGVAGTGGTATVSVTGNVLGPLTYVWSTGFTEVTSRLNSTIPTPSAPTVGINVMIYDRLWRYTTACFSARALCP